MGRVIVLAVLAVTLLSLAMFVYDDSAALIIPAGICAVLAFYYARRDAPDDFAGEYKPIVVASAVVDDHGKVRKSVIIEAARPRTNEGLHPHVEYAAMTAQITRAGIEARLEDGEERLVMWRDVIGIVVRRLPPIHDGATFVDLVSTAGATVRLVRWTRLLGDPLPDEPRAQARQLIAWCPRATLDPATRTFVDGAGEAAQLPDLATLAAHDAKLA